MSAAYDRTNCPPKASYVALHSKASSRPDAPNRKRWHNSDVMSRLRRTDTTGRLSASEVTTTTAILGLAAPGPFESRPKEVSKLLTLDFIADNAFTSPRTARRSIKKLEKLGVLRVKRTTRDFKTRNTYTVDLDVLYMLIDEWGPNKTLLRNKNESDPKPKSERKKPGSEPKRLSRLLAACWALAETIVKSGKGKAKNPERMRLALTRKWSRQLDGVEEPTDEILMGIEHAKVRVQNGDIHYWRAGYIRDELAQARLKRAEKKKRKAKESMDDYVASLISSMSIDSLGVSHDDI